MKRLSGILIPFILFGLLLPPVSSLSAKPVELSFSLAQQQLTSAGSALSDFELLTDHTGWILLDQALYQTQDGGESWQAITPGGLDGWRILAVDFSDSQTGWLAAAQSATDGSTSLRLERTQDGGTTWSSLPVELFAPGDPAGIIGAIHLDFISPSEGWMVVRRQSSSNFSLGTLFHTSDGGEHWTELPLPLGEPVVFSSAQIGFQVGGTPGTSPTTDLTSPSMDSNVYAQFLESATNLYRTVDGGKTWQVLDLLTDSDSGYDAQYPHYQLPLFRDPQHGLLPVLTDDEVIFFATDDGGLSWSLAGRQALASPQPEFANLPFSLAPQQSWLALIPPGVLYQISPGERQVVQSAGTIPAAGIFAISAPPSDIRLLPEKAMSSIWSAVRTGSCQSDETGSPTDCQQMYRLLRSLDGGQSWQPLQLPATELLSEQPVNEDLLPGIIVPAAPPLGAIPQRALSLTGHGFDKCELPGIANLQEWKAKSPYHTINLYFGGVWRACSNLGITASYLNQLSQLGWKFIPTWVGPQSKCFSSGSSKPRIPDNTTEAYDLGVSEAQAALSLAASLGLAHPDGSGTVLYYDLEAYDVNNSTCVKSAQAFTAGWSGEIQSRGSLAGMYSTGRSLDLLDTVQFPPQVIWPANWIYSSYNTNATVWNVFGLSNSLWADRQRIRQYAGGHEETWGMTTMTIDSNVMDGVVADISCPESLEGTGGMVLYRDASLRCGGMLSGAGYYSQGSSGWVNLPAGIDNAASSLRLADGWSLRLFENNDRQGGSVCLESDRDNFSGVTFDNGHALDNGATSVWLFDRPGCRDYQDTPPGDAAYNEIESVFLAGYRLGCDENTASFCAASALTRAQLAQLLETWRNGPDYKAPPAVAPAIFSDVPANADEAANPWYSAWVHLAWEDRLVEPCIQSPLAYCPDQAVKRSESTQAWLKTLHGSSYQPPPASGTVFSDVSAAQPYAAWIEQAWKDGLIDACAAGQFCPEANYLRIQAAHTLLIADGLKVQDHDPQQSKPPGAFSFSSYFGGSAADSFSGAAFDANGRQYLAGYSASTSLPGSSQPPLYGEHDVVLTQLTPDGSSPQFTRYLGGSRLDQAVDVAVDSNGYTVVLGITDSPNFNTQNASQPVYQGGRDLFVARYDPNGSLQWSTYLGGSSLDESSRIAVDGAGSIYITGWTASDNYPQPGGAALPASSIDAFVTRLNSNGTLAWSKLIGGSASDRAWDLALGAAGDLLIVGDTASTDFPLLNAVAGGPGGGQQIFLARLSLANGTLLSSSTIGGSKGDFGRGAWLDSSGAYAAGFTASSDFPLASPIQSTLKGGFDAFALQLTPSGSAWVFSSYMGGSGGDFARRVAAIPDGSLWLGGWSTSSDLPQSLYWPRQAGGSSDVFLSILLPRDGKFTDNLLLGGTAGERLLGMSLAGDGGVYLAGFSQSPNLPIYRPLQAQRGGGLDGFALKTALQHRIFIPLIRR